MISSTPVEEYTVGRRRVYVKRDDLCCRPPAPPLGKLRGLEPLLTRFVSEGVTTVGCWDTRVSKLGQGLAAMVRSRPLKAIVCYPHLKAGTVPPPVRIAEQLGAEIVRLRGNFVSICFAQASKIVSARGGVMIPFGLDCPESVAAIAEEARRVPASVFREGTVVLSCGSGVTLAGLLHGFDPLPQRIIGVSSGRSLGKLRHCIRKHFHTIPANVLLVPAIMPYDRVPARACPFPAHPNYDLKAWAYLVDHVASLRPPVLFWNIGA